MIIPRLSELDLATAGATKPLKVCVASLLGAAKNGGVGTATSGLIKQLAADGHRVTLLYTLVEEGKPVNVARQSDPTGRTRTWQQWVDALAAEGITLEFIPHQGGVKSYLHKSWLVKEFIGKHDFDVVYFDDWHGSGYFSLLAKRAGLAPFSTQLHCVITHASKQWISASNDEYIRQSFDIEEMGLERRSVELADVVIGPSRYLLREYESYGWRLPARTYHQPYPLFRAPFEAIDKKPIEINELVFFGRHEVRKGLWLFCEALDRLAERLRGKTVTFLGPTTYAYGISSEIQILNRAARWPFRVRLVTDFSTEQAVSYLKQGNKLAVMPSLADNSPCVVYECMEAGVPFVTTLGSGAEELIEPGCWPDVMAEPKADALTERLAQILDKGARLARPSFDPRENLDTWSAWHRYIADDRAKLIATPPTSQAARVMRANASEKKAILLVMIDEGECALQLLIENLATHVKRFGNLAAYLVISSRRGAIQQALFDLFKGASIRFFDASEINEARKIIGESEFAFFLDVNVEMLTPFFVLALDMLARKPSAVVTCVGAVRSDISASVEIEQLPTGDLPGLSTFDERIGGPVWAVSPSNLGNAFSSVEFYDKRLDVLVSASSLGELFMQRHRLANETIEMIPIVGVVATRGNDETPRTKTFEETQRAAAALGIAPSLYAGQAPWYAVSAFAQSQKPERVLLGGYAAVSSAHSLHSLQARGGGKDLSLLAATLGRPELAIQLEASRGGSAERIKKLIDVAVEAARQRPTFDLAELLLADRVMVFGQNPFPEKADDKTVAQGRGAAARGEPHSRPVVRPDSPSAEGIGDAPEAVEPHVTDAVAVYLDKRLRIINRKVQSTGTLRTEGPGKLFFFDVPLCGNSFLAVKLRSSGSTPLFLRIKAVDQQTGEEMSVASTRLLPNETSELSLPLYEIYGRAAILLEFSGAARMDVVAEAIRVQ